MSGQYQVANTRMYHLETGVIFGAKHIEIDFMNVTHQITTTSTNISLRSK